MLQRRAVEEARRRRLDGVIVGHSHVARDVRVDGVHYLNSGCWTEKPASFIGIRGGDAKHYSWDDLRDLPSLHSAPSVSINSNPRLAIPVLETI